ncbi:MAG: methyl-accepting chemotaxis protein [Ignavibacteriae bacterium]|nr:methyl-accepting chemotaxis protein [Ignavibacteriota bacterium]
MGNDNNSKSRKKYFVVGFVFGMMFPIIAFVIRVFESNIENALILISTDPLLWIICLAPIILGAAAYFGGIKQDEVDIKVRELLATQKTEEELNNLETAIFSLASIIEKIGQFDLSVKIEKPKSNQKSQSSQLAEVLSITLFNLQTMVHDLVETVNATNLAKENIDQTSVLISEGIDKQNNEISLTSHNIDELANYISENNQNAHSVANITSEANSKLGNLSKVIDLTSDGMENINQAVKEASEIILDLSESGEQIGDIVTLITDIAIQTKLLALNASIEAARAGKAGKGFAVVADEVGKLSEKTQEAITEISSTIQGIKSFTKKAVSKMNKGSEEIYIGKEHMKEVHEELDLLGNEMLMMVNNTEELANINQKQDEISNTIKTNIENIEYVTNSNVSNVLQISEAVNNLDNTVENVNKIIHKFKLEV